MLISSGFLQPNVLTTFNNNYGEKNFKNYDMDSYMSLDLIHYNDNSNNIQTNYNMSSYDVVET